MTNVGFATLSVIPSFQGFQSRLSAGVAAPMTSAGQLGGRKYGDAAGREAGDRFRTGFGARLKGFAPLAGLAVGAGAVAFFKSAIDGASDLSESGNKINAIFGEAQAQVQDFAADASGSLGQTKLQALDAASTFGTFGKAAGLSGEQLAGFSTELVSLSTDMASFYNTDVSTAIEAIGSGLRGEAEPLRQFGVLLDDATLRQEALRQGLVKTTKQALTPQQKVLAAHAVILQQTTDAQGDFERTSDGLANQQRILTAQWEEMKTKVGAELLPAMTGFVSFLSQDALPALGEVGGVAKDAASAFGDLPDPIKASAAAFVALRVAAATGLTSTAAAGASSLTSSMVGLRLRTMLAADAFRDARTTTVAFNGNVGTISRQVGVLSASLQGLRAGAAGAGSALRSGLGGAMSLLGGPWGLAMIAGTAAVAHFWGENQRAKQYVDDLTASLDKQTGSVTANTRELVFNNLQQSGAIDAAKNLGISLDDLRRAALGNEDAMFRVNNALREVDGTGRSLGDTGATVAIKSFFGAMSDGASDAYTLQSALGDTSSALDDAKRNAEDFAAFQGSEAVSSNDQSARSFKSLADRISEARDEVDRLAAAEQKRRLANLADRKDRLALVEQMQATAAEATNSEQVGDIQERIREAREQGAEERRDLQRQLSSAGSDISDLQKRLREAKTAADRKSISKQISETVSSNAQDRADISRRIAESFQQEREQVADLQGQLTEYTRTLNINTKAGQENLESLYSLADQWNNSSGAVRNAKGAYDELRAAFVKSAEQMGATERQANRLADQLLLLPKDKRIDITTPGMDQALADLAEMRKRLKDAGDLALRVSLHNETRLGNNANGTDFWRGGPTWVGERGPEIVNLPRGSQVIPNHEIQSGVNVNIEQVVAYNYNDLMGQVSNRARRASLDGVR